MSLAALQREFLARLFAPGEPGGEGIAVYRRTVRANRAAALRAAHPVVARLVGEAFFDAAAERYAERHPSREGDLHRYGESFAAFLAQYPHAAALPYLPDVARLEWALFRCEFAADPVPFDPAALAAVPAARHGELRFVPQDGVALVASAYPIVSIHEANLPGRDGALDAPWRGETGLVHRRGLEAVASRVGPEAGMLEGLLAGEPLARCCRDEADAAALPRWVAAGVFQGIAA